MWRSPVVVALIGVLLTGQTVGAQTTPGSVAVTQQEQREVAVTIYNGNLGLVKDIGRSGSATA